MALSYLADLTTDFNNNSAINIDVSGYDYGVVQLVSPSGAINFKATNDGGAVQGETQGDASTATNFIGVQVTNLNSGSAVTSANASGLYRFGVVGQYFRLDGTAVTATKVLVYLFKIS